MHKVRGMRNKTILNSIIYIIIIIALSFNVLGLIDAVDSNYPTDDYYTNNETPEFNFTVYGNSETYNCTIYIDDAPYGVDYSVFNNTPTLILANSSISESVHVWYVNCTDSDEIEISVLRTITIDINAPTTTALGNGGAYEFGNWTASEVNITLTCNDGDNSSGCQFTYNCVDTDNSCTPNSVVDSVIVSEPGTRYMRYYSIDNLNNTEQIKNVTIKIDNSTPSVTINLSSNQLLGDSSIPYILGGTVVAGSGIDTLKIFFNGISDNIVEIGAENWNYTWNPSEDSYDMFVEVCDLLATCVNSSIVSNITIDLTAPITTDDASSNWATSFTITLNANDDNGVDYTSYKLGDLDWENGTNIIINSTTDVTSGNMTLLYYSVDVLGNQENITNITLRYDIAAPESVITGFLENGSEYTFDVWSANSAFVNLTGIDADSGYNYTHYCIDDANSCTPNNTWTATFNVTDSGITYIRYRSIDNLNNTELIKIKKVMILGDNTVYINESVTVSENETNIIVTEDSNNSNVYVPAGINATLDFSEIINVSINDTHNVTLSGSINTTVNTTIIIAFEIPSNITLSGNSSWLGTFNLPKLMPTDSVTITVTGYTTTNDIVLEIGADDVPLLLDKAVRIKLTGKSDKLLWYGSEEITAICVNDTQEWANANLSVSLTGHCKITENGTTNLIIWTKHLSKFVAYSLTEIDDGNGGGGGGGSNSGGSSSSSVPYVSAANVTNPSVSYTYLMLEKGTRTINITHSQIPLYRLILTTNSNISNARLKITQVNNSIIAQKEIVYKYLQIDHETISDSNITGAKLLFKIPKSWLTENKIEKNQVVLYRYTMQWDMLSTTLLTENSDNVYYEASSPGLSIFAIATKPTPPVTIITPVNDSGIENDDDGELEINPELGSKRNSSIPIIVVILLIGVIVLLLYIFYDKKKKKKSKNN